MNELVDEYIDKREKRLRAMDPDIDNTRLYLLWFFNEREPTKNVPYSAILMHSVCDKDHQKFSVAEGVMEAAFKAGLLAGRRESR